MTGCGGSSDQSSDLIGGAPGKKLYCLSNRKHYRLDRTRKAKNVNGRRKDYYYQVL